MATKRFDLSEYKEFNLKVYTFASILVGVMKKLFKN